MGLEMYAELETLALKAPFRITGKRFDALPVAVVTLERNSRRGRGEAAGVYYRDDGPAQIVERLNGLELPQELSRRGLRELLPPGGVRNALDCALWDLEAKEAQSPAWRLAGLAAPRAVTTALTLGADTPEVMAQGAVGLAHARSLKLKLTGETELDGERVRAVRAARPEVWIGVDANQGYAPDTLEPLIPVLVEAEVKLLEQPFARGREADMDGLGCPIPTAADESCLDLVELETLPGRFDVVNIKLDKCGGLTEGLMIAARARELGLGVMVGNMMGTSLAMGPAFLLGQVCDICDLDGAIFLAADRDPPVRYENGTAWVDEAAWGGPAAPPAAG